MPQVTENKGILTKAVYVDFCAHKKNVFYIKHYKH
jgi:hypothetical protein